MALAPYTLKKQRLGFYKPIERCGCRNAPSKSLADAGPEPWAPISASAVRCSAARVNCGDMTYEEDLPLQSQVWAPPSSVEHLSQHEQILTGR